MATYLALGSFLASCASSGTATAPLPGTSVHGLSERPALSERSGDDRVESPRPAPPPPPQGTVGPREGEWEYTFGASGQNDNDFDVGGFSLGGSAGYFFDAHQKLGLRQSITFADFGDSQLNGATRVFYDYHFGDGEFRPLIGANFGYVYGDSINETFAAAPEAGFKWYTTDSAFFFLLAEYQFFFDEAEAADEAFDDGSFAYTVGIGVHK